jgi:carbon storage regulator
MLALTRKTGQEIVIDGQTSIRVLAIEGNKIRIGICAPEWISVDRREVHERRAQFAVELKRRARRAYQEQRS